MASFYQGGRGSTLRGKWMISFQSEGEGGAYLADGDQFFLLGGRDEKMWGAYLEGWETNSSFQMEARRESGAYFPNVGPRRGLSILNSWQGMG